MSAGEKEREEGGEGEGGGKEREGGGRRGKEGEGEGGRGEGEKEGEIKGYETKSSLSLPGDCRGLLQSAHSEKLCLCAACKDKKLRSSLIKESKWQGIKQVKIICTREQNNKWKK